MKKLFLMSSIAAAALAASSAQAAVSVCTTPNCVPTDENILVTNDPTPGNTVTGKTNSTNVDLLYTSDEDIVGFANGQARVEASDGSLNSIMFELLDGYTFSSAVFNLFKSDNPSAMLTITYYTPGANVWGTQYSVAGKGENYFGIEGAAFSAVRLDLVGGGVVDLRQLRLGGVAKVVQPPVPEPATWAMLIGGLGLVGVQMRRRKTTVSFA